EIQPEGAGFRSHMAGNLLASDDEWSAPIMGAVGPDGNVWVIDWYNFIVQHNPTPSGWTTGKGNAYESELRDKTHGRIYRIVYKGPGARGQGQGGTAAATSRFSLQGAATDRLITTLSNDNMLWRLHAQRLLVEAKHVEALPALAKLAAQK